MGLAELGAADGLAGAGLEEDVAGLPGLARASLEVEAGLAGLAVSEGFEALGLPVRDESFVHARRRLNTLT